jgi:hypothetical protein
MVFRRRARRADATPVASLFDRSKIDLITSEPDDTISLIVIQDQPWLHTAEELQSLVAKINNYVEGAAGGRLAAS